MNIVNVELASRPQGGAPHQSTVLNTINADQEMGSNVFKILQGITHDPMAGIEADITSQLTESLNSALSVIRKKQAQSARCKLTARELEVLRWIGKGKSTWDISVILDRSESVIKWHVKNLLNKLSAVNRPQAVAIAVRQGLID